MTQVSDQAQYQFISNVAYNSASGISDLPNGSLAVIDMDGSVQTGALTSTAYYMIVQKKADGGIIKSPIFLASDIVTGSKSQTAFVPKKNQVTYIGTNTAGTTVTGLGSHTAGDIYKIGIGVKNWGSSTTSLTYRDIAYSAVTGDADINVVSGLFDSAQRALKRTAPAGYPPVAVQRIAEVDSIAAFTGTAVIYKFTKNSTSVATYVKDADATSGITASTASVTAGNIIGIATTNGRTFTFTADICGTGAGRHVVYIGETSVNVADAGTAAQNATAIAAAINASTTMGPIAYASASSTTVTVTYKNDKYYAPPMVMQTDDDSTWVNVAVTMTVGDSMENIYLAAATTSGAATFTLDKPWQGETCYLYETTGTGTTASCGIVTNSTAKYGLKFSGLAPTTFDQVNDDNLPVTFLVEPFRDGGTTTIESSVNVVYYQAADEGSGNFTGVAIKEVQDQFQNKSINLQAYPKTPYKLEASANNVYSLLEFRVKNELNSNLISSNPKIFTSYEIAVKQTLATDIALFATVFGL